MQISRNSVSIRFGPFELDVKAGELQKNGHRIRLQEQPFKILLALLQRRGEVITREELQNQLWPDGTNVDFDKGINSAIKRLRDILNDRADKPKYVETVGRRGYRFLLPVEWEEISPAKPRATVPAHDSGPALSSAPGSMGEKAVLFPEPKKRLVRRRVKQLLLAFSMAAVAVWVVAVSQRSHWFGRLAFEGITSVAVLPLENLSGDKEQEYFAEGMTDELITNLGKLSALRVISRTSVMQYRGTKKPLPEVARELNVDALVEGTVLRAGDRVRITAQLIRAVPEKHLWSESYERDLRNVLGLQAEVARAIAGEIQIKLTSQERAGLSSARPVDPVAHESYLRGIYLWNKRTEQDLQKSIEYFNRAVERDPSYPLGYAGLANAYNALGMYAHFPPRTIYPQARAAALKALALDDTLAEAHAALGLYDAIYQWDQPGADRELRRAIELNPGYALAHMWLGETLSTMRRHREALAELDRARGLDPTSLMVSDQRGWVLYMAQRYDEAIEQIRKTIELEPRFAHAHCWLGKAYLQKRMLQEGLSELQEAASLPGGDSPVFAPWLGYAYALCGKRAEAFKIINTMKAQRQKSFGSPLGIAAIYCGLGEKEEALVWLEEAYQERDPQFAAMGIEPPLKPLRSDPQFQELMRRSTMPP